MFVALLEWERCRNLLLLLPKVRVQKSWRYMLRTTETIGIERSFRKIMVGSWRRLTRFFLLRNILFKWMSFRLRRCAIRLEPCSPVTRMEVTSLEVWRIPTAIMAALSISRRCRISRGFSLQTLFRITRKSMPISVLRRNTFNHEFLSMQVESAINT